MENEVCDVGRGTCKLEVVEVVGLNRRYASINVTKFPNSLSIIAMR